MTFGFGSTTGNLGLTKSYIFSSLTVVASGFDNTFATTALYGKHDGGNENGVGLANDPIGEHEISFGKGFVQIDVSQLFGKIVPGSATFTMGSTSAGEEWGVFGSNTPGSYTGGALLTGGANTTQALPNFGTYAFYDFVEVHARANDNVLLDAVTVTPGGVPEPMTWAMMLVGAFGVGAALRRRPVQIAAV